MDIHTLAGGLMYLLEKDDIYGEKRFQTTGKNALLEKRKGMIWTGSCFFNFWGCYLWTSCQTWQDHRNPNLGHHEFLYQRWYTMDNSPVICVRREHTISAKGKLQRRSKISFLQKMLPVFRKTESGFSSLLVTVFVIGGPDILARFIRKLKEWHDRAWVATSCKAKFDPLKGRIAITDFSHFSLRDQRKLRLFTKVYLNAQ